MQNSKRPSQPMNINGKWFVVDFVDCFPSLSVWDRFCKLKFLFDHNAVECRLECPCKTLILTWEMTGDQRGFEFLQNHFINHINQSQNIQHILQLDTFEYMALSNQIQLVSSNVTVTRCNLECLKCCTLNALLLDSIDIPMIRSQN